MANRDSSLQIGQAAIVEIRQLHEGILSHARQSVGNAIRIGEILTQLKAVMTRGEWMPWAESQLPFSLATAQRWMLLFIHKDDPEILKLRNLSEGYALLFRDNGNGRQPQQLHESNFWSASIKLTQGLTGRINHELKDRPIDSWGRDKWVSLAAALEPLAELYARLKTLIG